MKSIHGRLRLGLIVILLAVGVVTTQVSLWLFELGVQRYLESGLRNESELLLVAMIKGPTGPQLDEHRLSQAYQRPYSGHYFRIDFPEGHWRSRSLWDLELPIPDQPGLRAYRNLGNGDQSLLLLRWDYRKFGQPVSITVAQDYTPVRAAFARVQQLGLGIGLAALLVLLALQRLTVRHALHPLNQMREQIAQLQRGQRTHLDSEVPRELAPLVAQVNHLLAHTEDSLKRSRHALGNLGHSLKTPLAVLMSLAASEKLNAHPELRATLEQNLEQIHQRLGRELNRARLSGDALPSVLFDCAVELPELLSTLRMIHGDHLELSSSAEPGLGLPWDREDVLELLGNLLDNACKWADRQVKLSIDQAAAGYSIDVDDDGPGIPAPRREQVLNRGARLDEHIDGHGLGLGIVRDIVDAWGGQLSLRDSPMGGLRVHIELPERKAPVAQDPPSTIG